MPKFSLMKETIENSIHNQILRGIEVSLHNGCWGSALILIYSAMDAMASLARPEKQTEVTSNDFIKWVSEYVPLEGQTTVTGAELYSARCGILHNFGVESRKTSSGECRKIGYMHGGIPPIRYNSRIAVDLILIDILTLANSFKNGVIVFMDDFYKRAEGNEVLEDRLRKLICTFPV